MSRRLLQLALLALCFAGGWLVHARSAGADEGAESETEAAPVAPAQMAVPVRTAEVREGSLPRTLVFYGAVRAAPGAEHALSARCGGRVSTVRTAAGAQVHAGDVLLEIERTPLEAALAVAQTEERAAALALESFASESERRTLELAAAERHAAAELELAAARVERLSALVTDGLAAPKTLAEARSAETQARRDSELAAQANASWTQKGAALEKAGREAALEGKHAAAQEARALLEGAQLKAPADGLVVRLDVRAGDNLEHGATAGVLLEREGRVLVAAVSPAELAHLRVGLAAHWGEPGAPERTGHIASLVEALDPATGTAELRIAPDAGPAQPLGLVVRGEIVLEELEHVLLVPAEALVRSQQHTDIVVLGEGGLAHRVQVEVLARHAGLAAIRGEAHAGQALVVDGAYNLPEGARTVALPAEAAGEAK